MAVGQKWFQKVIFCLKTTSVIVQAMDVRNYMKIIKYLGYLYSQYTLKQAMKARKNGVKGTLCSEAAEFRKYYIK
jgi:hypothetical protein